MLELVLFDYDGTLFPTHVRQEKWFKYWAKLNNKPWPFEQFSEFLRSYNTEVAKDGGVQNFYDALKLPCDMQDRSHPVWPAYIAFNQENPSEPYPGVKETLKKIDEMGILPADPNRNRKLQIGINTTNTWTSMYKDLVKADLIRHFFGHITEEYLEKVHGAGNGNALKKPSTISVAYAMGLLGSEGATTIHVGDTLNDLKSSQKVIRLNPNKPETLITVGACYGYEGRSILEQGADTPNGKVHFDYLIDKPEELIPIVQDRLN